MSCKSSSTRTTKYSVRSHNTKSNSIKSSSKTNSSTINESNVINTGHAFDLIRSKIISNHQNAYPKFQNACIEPKSMQSDLTSDCSSEKHSNSSRVSYRTMKSSVPYRFDPNTNRTNSKISDLLVISQIPFDFYENFDANQSPLRPFNDPNVSLLSSKSKQYPLNEPTQFNIKRNKNYVFVYRQSCTNKHVNIGL